MYLPGESAFAGKLLPGILIFDILNSEIQINAISGRHKMQNLKPFVTAIKARGQLTIPKKIRQKGQLEEGQVVSLIPVGDSVIVTPRQLPLDEARREIKKILRQAGLSVEEVLAGIREEREALYEEIYGKGTDQSLS